MTGPGPVELSVDAAASSRRIARDAVEYLCRESGLPARDARALSSALDRSLRFIGRAGPGGVLCAVSKSEGEVRLRLRAMTTQARSRIPAGVRRESEALLRSLRRRVSRADWTAPVSSGMFRLLLVQRREETAPTRPRSGAGKSSRPT